MNARHDDFSAVCAIGCIPDADCPSLYPACLRSYTDRSTNTSEDFTKICGVSTAGMCSRFLPC